MSGEEPIKVLVRELTNSSYYGQLNSLRSKLGISASTLEWEPLSRRKRPSLTYKLTELRTGYNSTPFMLYNYYVSWVVKFSPKDKQADPWYDVHKEYYVLSVADRESNVPVPKPLHSSSAEETRVVGTKFIIMNCVEGKSHECASKVPLAYRRTAFSSVMEELAKMHNYYWITQPFLEVKKYVKSDSFWQSQVTCWSKNYNMAARRNYAYYGYQPNDTDRFFETMSSATKPANGGATVIHGDMDISNIIFDDQYKVKAIIDWKWDRNGDPMVDVAYFCMMFLRPLDYGNQYRPIENHPLLLGDGGQLEDHILDVYKRHRTFNDTIFLYAKAVCYLRLLSIMKAAVKDNFEGHVSGTYKDNTLHPQLVMNCLTAAGQDYYKRSN